MSLRVIQSCDLCKVINYRVFVRPCEARGIILRPVLNVLWGEFENEFSVCLMNQLVPLYDLHRMANLREAFPIKDEGTQELTAGHREQ